ncbi:MULTISPECIES: hypothetical protein [Stenotrophomonas]|jgi:hypothetical protein|uniref:Transmembrane protein n=1 Tax=Stenotrophomonas maltophilia TaxID=40324 RepID=A0A4S2CXY7_STEMA|nr:MULTISPECIES: hypothetical protein [Stenotrophomonas]MBD3827824.1 hypothetical protein [Stenotrophomonas sp.]TGY33889.1 hypothetical protein E5352_10965 [Stenotrophomonas maltophilia]HBS62164.1 hypothetical protein [Stenotrophomonas sp.]
MSLSSSHRSSRSAELPDPRVLRCVRQAALAGLALVLVWPAARGYSSWLGWGPLWLVGMPWLAWWALYRFRLPLRWWAQRRAGARRRAPQARRRRPARRLRAA